MTRPTLYRWLTQHPKNPTYRELAIRIAAHGCQCRNFRHMREHLNPEDHHLYDEAETMWRWATRPRTLSAPYWHQFPEARG